MSEANVPRTDAHNLDTLDLLSVAHTPSEADDGVLCGAIKRSGVVFAVTCHGRYQGYDAFLIPPKQSAQSQTSELDLQILEHVDLVQL